MKNQTEKLQLLVSEEMNRPKILTILIGSSMVLLSLIGLIFPNSMYKSEDLIQTYFTNDVINLLVGLPVLLGSLWHAQRGKLVGYLLWPGALLFILYNYIAYLVGIPLGVFTLAYLILVLGSAYNIYEIFSRLDNQFIKDRLSGKIYEKLAGWFLVVFGILFILRAANIFAGAIFNQTDLPATEIGTLVADLVISILWIIGGSYLLRGVPLGYSSGLGLLFAASMLFLGLIIFLLIQPFITTVPFSLVDILVVAIMGLILSIPFVLYLRGTLKSS